MPLKVYSFLFCPAEFLCLWQTNSLLLCKVNTCPASPQWQQISVTPGRNHCSLQFSSFRGHYIHSSLKSLNLSLNFIYVFLLVLIVVAMKLILKYTLVHFLEFYFCLNILDDCSKVSVGVSIPQYHWKQKTISFSLIS